MKFKKFLILILPILIILLMFTPNVHGNSVKLAYIYYDDPTTANSYNSFLTSEGFSIDLIDVDIITTGTFDTHDIIIIGPDLGSGGGLYMSMAKVSIVNDSGAPIIGLGNGGYAFFGLNGISLYIGYDEGSSTIDITNIDVVDDAHAIFNTPNDLPSGNIQLYSPGSRVYFIPLATVPGNVDVYGKVASSSYSYCICAEDTRYFLWGFEDSLRTMSQNGKDLLINIINYYAPPAESGIFGYNLLILIGIVSVTTIILIKKKCTK